VARLRDQSGFGMLELLIAMVILNIGVFALVGVFNASAVAIRRAGDTSTAAAVADKQMELYRSLQNCAIWLDRWLMPAAGTQYALDQRSYNGTAAYTPQIPYWSTVTPANQQYWVTDGMDNASTFQFNGATQVNLASCAYKTMSTSQTLPLTSTNGSSANIDSLGTITPMSTSAVSTVKPVQTITGADGVGYPVYTYIVLIQSTGGEWAKQVTIVVYDPRDTTRKLARETSVFDWTVSQ
jgi:type II secretory pathway pseudopilin PulG